MKKVTVFALILAIVVMAATTVNAATEKQLLDKLKGKYTVAGENVSLSSADLVQIERYLQENEVSEEQASQLIAKVDEIVSYSNTFGVKNIASLTKEQKEKILSKISEGAAIIDLKVSYDATNKSVKVSDKSGKIIFTKSTKNVLAATGGVEAAYIALPAVGIIALAAVAARLKK